MSDFTNSIKLPLLFPSQADKHVTVNQSLQKIDTVLMASVTAIGQNTPPSAPTENLKVLVGAQPTGIFVGRTNQLATYLDDDWQFALPQIGWIVFASTEQRYLAFNGTNWSDLGKKLGAVQDIPLLGLGTSADPTAPFAAKLNSALWTALSPAEGGSGSLRIALNKSSSTQTGSILFQSNYIGRAEFGLVGTDAFSMRVSNDGTNWDTALRLVTGGRVELGQGFSGTIDLPQTVPTGKAHVSRDGARFLTLYAPSGCSGENLFLGDNAGSLSASGTGQNSSYNVGMGVRALTALTTGHGNTSIGHSACQAMTTGIQNTVIGSSALTLATTALQNSALGHAALYSTTTGIGNTGLGFYALFSNSTGTWNTGLGAYSLMYQVDGSPNTSFTNCAGLGADTRVSGSNQVQLGNNATNVYAYGAIQNRSDPRDKADICPTKLGLDFILALEPIDFRWNYRDAHFDPLSSINPRMRLEKTEIPKVRMSNSSKKRSRFHHGLNAEQVHDVMQSLGVDFGGYQDHSRNGGSDVKTIGYSELFAPLIKAIQELHLKVMDLQAKV
jgi:hypothetical protein